MCVRSLQALTYNYMERYADSERTLKGALLILMKRLPPLHPRLDSCKKTLAMLRVKAAAEKKASAVRAAGALEPIRLPGDGDADAVAGAADNAAAGDKDERDLPPHGILYDNTGAYVPERTNATMTDRANQHIELGQYEEALKWHQEAFAFTQNTMPADHVDIAQAMSNLATSLYYLKRYDESETLLTSALAILKKKLPPSHPDITTCKKSLKNLRAASNRPTRPKKAAKPNAKCPCGSLKKYKKCCGKLV